MSRYFPIDSITEPPEWWRASFLKRQREIKHLIRVMLKEVDDEPLFRDAFFAGLLAYERSEIEHALASMVADNGLFMDSAQRYRMRYTAVDAALDQMEETNA